MGVPTNTAVGYSFADKLFKRILSDPWRELARALSRAVGPVAFLDVTNRPLRDDHPVSHSFGGILGLGMPNAEVEDSDTDPDRPLARRYPPESR